MCFCFIVYHNTCVVVNMKNDCIDFLGNNGLFFQVRSEPMSIKYGCQLEKKDYHIGYNGFNVQFCIVDQLEQKQTDLFMSNITCKMHSSSQSYDSYLSEGKEQSNSSGRIKGVINLFRHHHFACQTGVLTLRNAISQTFRDIDFVKSATVQFFFNILNFIQWALIPSLERKFMSIFCSSNQNYRKQKI